MKNELQYVTSPMMRDLFKREEEAGDKLLKIRDAIKGLQSICDHIEMKNIGHDSHYDHKICINCGWIDYKA